jgi:hypothetical protein
VTQDSAAGVEDFYESRGEGMSIVYRLASIWLLLVAPAMVLAQPEESPSVETLRRMAKQLGTGQNTLPKIDAQTLELAREFLKKNPQFLNDPAMKARIEAMKQQMQQNPEAFRKQFEENNTLTKDQMEQFRKDFENRPKPDIDVGPQPVKPPPMPEKGNPDVGQKGGPTPRQKPDPNVPQPKQNNPVQNNPFQQKEEKARNSEGYRNMAGLWEKNVGSLDKTPAMKQTLTDMFGGTGGQGKGWGNGGFGNNKFGNPNGGSGSGITNWFKNRTWNGTAPSWWSNMNLGNRFNFGGPTMPSFGAPSAPSFGGGGFALGGLSGLGTIGIVIMAIIVAAIVAFVLYRYWPQIQAMRSKPSALPGVGAWTIDPRDVRDRPTLIQAFEYVSLFLCGDSAKVWNHATIAAAFVDRIPKSAGYAEPLARLYARARYTPEHEVFTAADIAEARGYLCQLAGVPNE